MASDGLPASKQAAKKALAALLSLSVVSPEGVPPDKQREMEAKEGSNI